MNLQHLSGLYYLLNTWERIPLLIAADARGDETEARRLFNASPLRTWRFSEHLLAEQALHVATMIYVGEQLDAAASYFFSLWQMDDADDVEAADWLFGAEVNAYFFSANAAAWQRFCEELGIEAEVLTAANHRGWFLRYCEEHMPANAPTAAALQARLREADPEARPVVTADDLLASWRKLLRQMTRHDPPPREEP